MSRERRQRAPLDVLLLDARLRQTLVSVRSLGRSGLTVGVADRPPSIDVPAFHSRWCRARALVADVAVSSDAFVQSVLELLDRRPSRVLVPLFDGTIAAVRGRREEFERRVRLALPSEEALDVAVDKARTAAVAGRVGVPVPPGTSVRPGHDVAAWVARVGLPAVVKPHQSWVEDGAGGHRVACRDAVSLAEVQAAVARITAAGGRASVQRWLPGAREAVSLFYARGRVWARFAQRADRMHPPIGGSSIVRVSVPLPPDATRMAEELVREIGIEGYSEVEFRRDELGRPVLMEINPRLSASVEVAVRSGVDFPRLLFAWAAGEPLAEVHDYRIGCRMRWLGGDARWLARNLQRALQGQRRPDLEPPGAALATFLGDFLRPARYDYVDPSDMRPALLQGIFLPVHVAGLAAKQLAEARGGG